MPAHPINIPKDHLKELYLKRKLSTDAVGKIFNCNHATVLNYLKKYNIPRRSRLGNRKPVNIPKEILFKLYHVDRLTQKQIAEKFGHSPYGVERWMKIYGIKTRGYSESHTKHPKFNFSGDSLQKAYLIGFRLGDLYVSRVKNLIQVHCSTTIKEQVNLIRELFKNYGYVHIKRASRGTFEISILLNQSFGFLLAKQDKIEDWVFADNKLFLSFLAGYADAEGSYYLRKPYYKFAKSGWGVFEIESYDKNILRSIFKYLTFLGIESSFYKARTKGYTDKRGVRNNKDAWRLTIVKKQSLWNFVKLIEPYHKHENKLRELREVKNNLLLRNTLPYCKPIIL